MPTSKGTGTGTGLTGLKNLGNTCYLNSCMQIISHCQPLNGFLSNKQFRHQMNKGIDGVLLTEWDDLHDLMWSADCVISPNRFLNIVQKIARVKNRELFTGFIQNDFPEYLMFLMDTFHNAVKHPVEMKIEGRIVNDTDVLAKKCYEVMKNMYSKEYSTIIDIFYGIQVSTITQADSSKYLSIIPEPYCLLSLSITGCNTIYDCLDLYCEAETMENENAWFNDRTKKYEMAKRRTLFWSLPDILIVDLKRFTNDFKKIGRKIDVPLTDLDLSKYVVGYDKSSYVYNLCGVCNHMGSCLGGHYTSFVKTSPDKNSLGIWHEFNDTQIRQVAPQQLISGNAYCLFFQKKK